MGHRHRKRRRRNSCRRSRARQYRNFRPGGSQWYRIPSEGYLAGICAGFADYYDISPLMARGIAVTTGLFMPQVVVIAYIVGIFMLPTRGEARAKQEEKEQTLWEEIEQREARSRRRQREFQQAYETVTNIDENDRYETAGSEPSLDSKRIMIRRFKERMGGLEGRLQNLERHVTSKRYDLAREIDSL